MKIEVATKLRVEKQKGRSQPEKNPNEVLNKKLKLRPFNNQRPQTMSRPLIQVATEEEPSRRNQGRNYF